MKTYAPFLPFDAGCPEARRCFTGFLKGLTDVYYQTDMEGTIVSISPSCFAHLGYTVEEMIGTKMAEYYGSASDRELVLAEFVKHNGNITHVEAALRHKNGELVWASTDACIRYDSENKPSYIEGTSRNITERKQLEDSLQQALVEQKLLIQVLCHDLKNPIGNAISILNLGDPALLAEYQEKISQSLGACLEMIDMINRMNHFNAKDQMVLESVKLDWAVQSAMETLEYKAAQKNIQFDVDVEPLEVIAESVSISNSVIANALSNAIKFSDRGSTVRIYGHQVGNWAAVEISDQGIGMAPSISNNLFDFAEKVSRQGTEGEVGTGHGLKLAKFFVEKYGGSVKVDSTTKAESNTDHGTTVTFNLKLKAS